MNLQKQWKNKIMETKIICNKCGSTNFVLRKSIFFCKDCGEMYKGDGKRYHIESVDVLTGEIKLGEIKLKKNRV